MQDLNANAGKNAGGKEGRQNEGGQNEARGNEGRSGQGGSRGQGQGGQGGERLSRAKNDLAQQGDQLLRDARELAEGLREAGGELESYLRRQMQERPYTVLLSAAAAGFIIGGGLASRTTRMAIGVGSKLAMTLAAQEVMARVAAAAGEPMGAQPGGVGEGAD